MDAEVAVTADAATSVAGEQDFRHGSISAELHGRCQCAPQPAPACTEAGTLAHADSPGAAEASRRPERAPGGQESYHWKRHTLVEEQELEQQDIRREGSAANVARARVKVLELADHLGWAQEPPTGS